MAEEYGDGEGVACFELLESHENGRVVVEEASTAGADREKSGADDAN